MLYTTAAAMCCLQLFYGIPTINATESEQQYGARRTHYYQDASCKLETFREFAYDAMSIETDGTSAQGKEWCILVTGAFMRVFICSLASCEVFLCRFHCPMKTRKSTLVRIFSFSCVQLAVDDFFIFSSHPWSECRSKTDRGVVPPLVDVHRAVCAPSQHTTDGVLLLLG